MRTQIRLAERQGLLTGHGLSALQVAAVQYCDVQETAEQIERDRQTFKYALLSHGHIPADQLFPDIFTEVVDDDSAEMEDDEEHVVYKFGEADMSPEEMERELAALMGGGQITVNGQEVADGR